MSKNSASQNISSDEIRSKILSIDSIANWAKKHQFNRCVVHQSINGKGSREIRAHLAILMNQKPSEIWKNRSNKLRMADDQRYNELLNLFEINTIEIPLHSITSMAAMP